MRKHQIPFSPKPGVIPCENTLMVDGEPIRPSIAEVALHFNPLAAVDVVRAFATYCFNVDFTEQFEAAYGRPPRDGGDPYFTEKVKVWERCPMRWFGELDLPNQRRLVDAAVERYGEQALRTRIRHG